MCSCGGGGGAFGPSIPNSSEVGARAEDGCDGAATAFGALTSVLIPAGGLAGTGAFVDADPRNDFFGRKLTPTGLLVGKLLATPAGTGGGAGGGGENTSFFDRIGGGSGGGSGGQLILQARLFDFSTADPNAIRAIGGAGGVGADNSDTALIGCGGDGGPGVVQVHTVNGTESSILLPPGMTLGDITIPDAHVLLPEAIF